MADRTLVNHSQSDEPLKPPMYGCRRAELQQEQSLYGQRASSLLVHTDFGNEHTVYRGLNVREVLVFECLKSAEPLEQHARK